MKLDVSKETYKPKWVEFDDCELELRPYPTGRNDIVFSANQEMTITGEQRKKIFMYSLMNWKGLLDVNDKEIPYSLETKEKIFDYNLGGIAGFVYQYNTTFEAKLGQEYANLQNGQDGDLTEKAKPAPIAEEQ